MAAKSDGISSVEKFDRLAAANSAFHSLDPRAKLIVALLAVGFVASFPRYAVAGIIPFFLLPVVWLALSGTPIRFVLGRLLLALPFVFFVAIFNPLFDQTPQFELGGYAVSGGWVSFFSIILRFLFSISLMILLVATTGFNTLCAALLRLRVPRLFVVQLLLLYRYIFLLAEEVQRVRQAYALRALGDGAIAFSVVGSLLGQLLLRVMARGQRIHQAMLCRGFSGDMPVRGSFRWRSADTCFLLGWVTWLVFARRVNISELLGQLLLRGYA